MGLYKPLVLFYAGSGRYGKIVVDESGNRFVLLNVDTLEAICKSLDKLEEKINKVKND